MKLDRFWVLILIVGPLLLLSACHATQSTVSKYVAPAPVHIDPSLPSATATHDAVTDLQKKAITLQAQTGALTPDTLPIQLPTINAGWTAFIADLTTTEQASAKAVTNAGASDAAVTMLKGQLSDAQGALKTEQDAHSKDNSDNAKTITEKDKKIASLSDAGRIWTIRLGIILLSLGIAGIVASFFTVEGVSLSRIRTYAIIAAITGASLMAIGTYLDQIILAIVITGGAGLLALIVYELIHWGATWKTIGTTLVQHVPDSLKVADKTVQALIDKTPNNGVVLTSPSNIATIVIPPQASGVNP